MHNAPWEVMQYFKFRFLWATEENFDFSIHVVYISTWPVCVCYLIMHVSGDGIACVYTLTMDC